MTFDDIPAGASVFIDANTFVYHFISDPSHGAACTTFLERIERREIKGWISPHVLAEVSHRLITLEACWTFGWPHQGIAARLRQHPHQFVHLQAAHRALTAISQLGLTVTVVTASHVLKAAAISTNHGLLTNDALIVAIMQDHGLTNIASRDSDFDRIPEITRYSPS